MSTAVTFLHAGGGLVQVVRGNGAPAAESSFLVSRMRSLEIGLRSKASVNCLQLSRCATFWRVFLLGFRSGAELLSDLAVASQLNACNAWLYTRGEEDRSKNPFQIQGSETRWRYRHGSREDSSDAWSCQNVTVTFKVTTCTYATEREPNG